MKTEYANEHASCQVVRNPELPAEMDRVLEVCKVWTDPDNRKQGFATELLKAVCDDADADGIVLILQPREFGHSSGLKELEAWYKRFGFMRTQNNPVLMARAPTANYSLSGISQAIGGLNG